MTKLLNNSLMWSCDYHTSRQPVTCEWVVVVVVVVVVVARVVNGAGSRVVATVVIACLVVQS